MFPFTAKHKILGSKIITFKSMQYNHVELTLLPQINYQQKQTWIFWQL